MLRFHLQVVLHTGHFQDGLVSMYFKFTSCKPVNENFKLMNSLFPHQSCVPDSVQRCMHLQIWQFWILQIKYSHSSLSQAEWTIQYPLDNVEESFVTKLKIGLFLCSWKGRCLADTWFSNEMLKHFQTFFSTPGFWPHFPVRIGRSDFGLSIS